MSVGSGVVLSMLTLVPGGMGGSETYARELVRELAAGHHDVSTLVAPVARGWTPGAPERVAPEYPAGPTTADRVRALACGSLRSRSLRRHTASAALVHYPFNVPVPRPADGQPWVVTVHDVQHHDLPGMFSRAERFYRSVAYDRPARAADAVITVSDFAKQRIVERLGVPAARVHVAHLGVRPAGPSTEEPAVDGEYLLYPARGWPHKNHRRLFEALALVRRRRPALQLVLTGCSPAELPPLPEGVLVLGRVSEGELTSLYTRASALVFPSLYEGFGLPVVEAMAAGCPVAAARAGALPEVVGSAGVLFDPRDPHDLAGAVEEALERSDELSASGRVNAARWTWAACAQVHEGVYAALGGTR